MYVDTHHVLLRPGVLGVKVKTMLLWDAKVNMTLSDNISKVEPNHETMSNTPAANSRTSGRSWSWEQWNRRRGGLIRH
ncbi:ribosomal protein S3e [Culex quinquefasciatus]|uniref:Ribosomal protein S3e n=1 Tax=Culex quinquefasciatus TaxID=7176 RepID=B0X9G3_CULQU|nr:ribosomal protein S3e [Culex quinquefasciatus]|eukprot:XP_001866284.1 ribosomal protein S3e [Culex quinquefasciatus]